MNGYQGQIRAIDQQGKHFLANQNIVDLINASAVASIRSLKRIEIFTAEGTRINFLLTGTSSLEDEIEVEIGKTKMYQLDEVQITSIKFIEDSPVQTIIDFIADI